MARFTDSLDQVVRTFGYSLPNPFLKLQAIESLIDDGLKVFPLFGLDSVGDRLICRCDAGDTCSSPGKHPKTRHGVKEATDCLELITKWWTEDPIANVGVATGKASGLIVLDVDRDKGGEHSLADLEMAYRGRRFESPSDTRIAITGRGRHFYFRYRIVRNPITNSKTPLPIKCSAGSLGPGLDIRADGGYVVAPPSLHATGTHYRWEYEGIPFEPFPRWLCYEVLNDDQSQRFSRNTLINKSARSNSAPVYVHEGRRNAYLFRKGCGLVNSYSPDEVANRLLDFNRRYCSPPLEVGEVFAIARSVERYRRW